MISRENKMLKIILINIKGDNKMVLEGKKPCIIIKRKRLRDLNSALHKAGYRRHKSFKFQKDKEIGTWTRDMDDENWIHVQVVKEGKDLEIFAHHEPSLDLDPFGHAVSAILESDIKFGVGSHALRSHLRKVGFKFK
jgi:hypothetical protein